jgi:hypothetical protein
LALRLNSVPMLHGKLVQRLASPAHARRREADDVLMAAGEVDLEPTALYDAEQLPATAAPPFLLHRALPPALSRK